MNSMSSMSRMNSTSSPTRALLAIIGGGNMAKAIVLGAIEAKLLAPFEMLIVEPDATKRRQFASWGLGAFETAAEALARLLPPQPRAARGAEADPFDTRTGLAAAGGQILLAVKPQALPDIASQLAPLLAANPRVVMSILAGTPIANIRAAFNAPELPVIRLMPNTPARLRKGMTAMSVAPGLAPGEAQFAHDLFVSLGEVVKIDESLMDAYTALAGSGPAYVFYLAQAMIAAAQELGFDRISADRIVRQTIGGSAALLSESAEPPEALRAAVTSKGGTTEAACQILDDRAVMRAVADAIAAGRDRGRQLAR